MALKKSFLLLFFLTAPFYYGFGQRAALYVRAIGGSYNMSSMKRFQNLMAEYYRTNGVDEANVTSEFPFSVQLDVGAEFKAKGIKFGPWLNYINTKGEVELKGNFYHAAIKHNLTRYSIGFKLAKDVYKNFGLYGKIGVNASILDVKSTGSSPAALPQSNSYLSNGGTLELGLQWLYSFNRFSVVTNLGYEGGISAKLNGRYNDYTLRNTEGESVDVNWSGIRIGVGIGFSLTKIRKQLTPKTIEIE